MDNLKNSPLTELLPAGLQPYAGYLLLGALGLGALIVLVILFLMVKKLFGGKKIQSANLQEDLAGYPPLKPSTGDRRLLVEGVPVRLRLVVVAPAGKQSQVDPDALDLMLERVVLGLGDVFKQDKPRVRVWPQQLSYQGFAQQFHRDTLVPEAKGEASPWVCVAGRVKLGKYQVMLGLAMQAVKPNTVGRRTLDAHEWPSVLRIRVRD